MHKKTKHCNTCDKTLDISMFYSRTHKMSVTWCSVCKVCMQAARKKWRKDNPQKYKDQKRRATLRREYNITKEEYDSMNNKQRGVCAICSGDNSGSTKFQFLVVDHDHSSGYVRGLLCSRCNMALGGFRDSPDMLHNALEYLDQFRC